MTSDMPLRPCTIEESSREALLMDSATTTKLKERLETAREHGVPIRIRKFDLGDTGQPSLVVGIGAARVVVAPADDLYDCIWDIDGENHRPQRPAAIAAVAGIDRETLEAIATDLEGICDLFVACVDELIADERRAVGARLLLEL